MDWDQYVALLQKLEEEVSEHKEEFDLILGIGRGGLIPATYLSHHLKLPMAARMVSSYKDELKTKYLIEGQVSHTLQELKDKRILIVDDIVDSACTLKQQIESLNADEKIKPKLIRTAVLVLKPVTPFKPDYYIISVDPGVWVKFPYEFYENM